jgi:hypothetical protein
LIELREKQFEKKFRKDKEEMIGTKPKIVWVAAAYITILFPHI